jgi:pyruvate dehydrogenase E1 component alpha subunit
VREGVIALGARPGAEMFDLVFQESTDDLLRQKKLWHQESEWREESEHA